MAMHAHTCVAGAFWGVGGPASFVCEQVRGSEDPGKPWGAPVVGGHVVPAVPGSAHRSLSKPQGYLPLRGALCLFEQR